MAKSSPTLNDAIDFQAIQKVFHAKDGREVGNLVYFVFDAAVTGMWSEPHEDYETRLTTPTRKWP